MRVNFSTWCEWSFAGGEDLSWTGPEVKGDHLSTFAEHVQRVDSLGRRISEEVIHIFPSRDCAAEICVCVREQKQERGKSIF